MDRRLLPYSLHLITPPHGEGAHAKMHPWPRGQHKPGSPSEEDKHLEAAGMLRGWLRQLRARPAPDHAVLCFSSASLSPPACEATLNGSLLRPKPFVQIIHRVTQKSIHTLNDYKIGVD